MKTYPLFLILVVLLVTACGSKPKHTPTPPPPTDTPVPPTATPILQPPDGSYTSSITKEELIDTGMTEDQACENAGVFNLTVVGERWDIIQTATPGCTVYNPKWGGSWKFSANQVTFHDDEANYCATDYTYQWVFNGSALRFTSVDDSDCEWRTFLLSQHPWVKEK